jgi:hypothetical protein
MTTPNIIKMDSSRVNAGMSAPSTITFLRESATYVSGKNFEMPCMNHGICSIGKNTPLRNIIGNIIVVIIITAVSWSLANDVRGCGRSDWLGWVEKFKIEKMATNYGIPVYAMIVRQSLKEVLSPITETLTDSADDVIKRLGRVIRERTKESDTVLVVGVGNTIGID